MSWLFVPLPNFVISEQDSVSICWLHYCPFPVKFLKFYFKNNPSIYSFCSKSHKVHIWPQLYQNIWEKVLHFSFFYFTDDQKQVRTPFRRSKSRRIFSWRRPGTITAQLYLLYMNYGREVRGSITMQMTSCFTDLNLTKEVI